MVGPNPVSVSSMTPIDVPSLSVDSVVLTASPMSWSYSAHPAAGAFDAVYCAVCLRLVPRCT